MTIMPATSGRLVLMPMVEFAQNPEFRKKGKRIAGNPLRANKAAKESPLDHTAAAVVCGRSAESATTRAQDHSKHTPGSRRATRALSMNRYAHILPTMQTIDTLPCVFLKDYLDPPQQACAWATVPVYGYVPLWDPMTGVTRLEYARWAVGPHKVQGGELCRA